jgi:two-component system probable response regulator PhcQ
MMIADRIVSLGLLAAGLSHQIRNSLVAVKTFLDLAPKKMAEERASTNGLRNPEFWKDYHQNVQSQMEKINNLLKDLWTASENPSAPFADEVSLRHIVEEALATLRDQFAARRIEIESRIPDSLPTLKVDRPKFRRLFELLFKEELSTLPADSRVSFSAELENGAKPEIVVQITDNGPGLSQDALRVVFDPFVVRDSVPSEYGINLMACFFIVHHHGGKIDAKSQPGQGTTFILRLPLQPERAVTPPAETDFLQKALLNGELWQKLIAGG